MTHVMQARMPHAYSQDRHERARNSKGRCMQTNVPIQTHGDCMAVLGWELMLRLIDLRVWGTDVQSLARLPVTTCDCLSDQVLPGTAMDVRLSLFVPAAFKPATQHSLPG